MIFQVALCVPLAFLWLIIFYLLGKFINRWIEIFKVETYNSYLNVFGNVLTGFILTGTVYAIAITHGKTTLSGLVILILAHQFFFKKGIAEPISFIEEVRTTLNSKTILAVVISFLFAYIFLVAQHYTALRNGYPISFYDYHFYAQVSNAIGSTGVESAKSMFFDYTGSHGTLLYHYLDLWTCDVIARITQLNHTILLLFLIYPLLLSMLVIGLVGVIKIKHAHFSGWQIIACLLLLFGANFYLNVYEHFPILTNFGMKSFPGFFSSHKLLIIFAMVVGSLSQILTGNKTLAALWLFMLCFAYPTVVPAVGGGIILFLFILFVTKNIDFVFALKIFALLVFTIGFNMAFDRIFSDRPRQVVAPPAIKTLIIVTVEYATKIVVVFIPVLLLLLLRMVKRIPFHVPEKLLLLFIFCSSASAVLFASLNHGLTNISQAIFNIIPPVVIVASVVFVLPLFEKGMSKAVKAILCLVFLFIGAYNLITDHRYADEYLLKRNIYSKKYMAICVEEANSSKTSDAKIALWNDDDIRWWYYDFEQRANFLFYSEKVNSCLDISPYLQTDRKVNTYFTDPDNYDNPIEKWIRANGDGKLVFDVPLLIKFFKSEKLNYLVVSKENKIPQELKEHLLLISEDENTGETFYKLTV